jgi:hypothetical protein
MDKKQAVVGIAVVAAILGLFVVVYAQFGAKYAVAPTVQQQKKMTNGNGGVTQQAVPIANPETVEDVSAAIDVQLAEDSKALDAEIAAETADIEGELNSLNELNKTYDENAY